MALANVVTRDLLTRQTSSPRPQYKLSPAARLHPADKLAGSSALKPHSSPPRSDTPLDDDLEQDEMETEPIELFEETSPDRKNSPISSTNSKEQCQFEFTPIDTGHGLFSNGGTHTVKDEEGDQTAATSFVTRQQASHVHGSGR